MRHVQVLSNPAWASVCLRMCALCVFRFPPTPLSFVLRCLAVHCCVDETTLILRANESTRELCSVSEALITIGAFALHTQKHTVVVIELIAPYVRYY